jgi:uncharacterized protein (DUF1330 family)
MSAYVLIEITINDRDMYLQYIEKAKPIVERHGGEYIIRGGEITPLFGDWNPERIIVIRFPSRDKVSECFGSDEYLRVAGLRENSTITRSIILDGYEAT